MSSISLNIAPSISTTMQPDQQQPTQPPQQQPLQQQQQLPSEQARQQRPVAPKKKRFCQFCRNHEILKTTKGHKKDCSFRAWCICTKCLNTKARHKVNAKQVAIKRGKELAEELKLEKQEDNAPVPDAVPKPDEHVNKTNAKPPEGYLKIMWERILAVLYRKGYRVDTYPLLYIIMKEVTSDIEELCQKIDQCMSMKRMNQLALLSNSKSIQKVTGLALSVPHRVLSFKLVNTQFGIRLTCTVEAPQLHQVNENAQVITKYESVERVDFEPTNKAEIWLPARFKTIIDEKTIDSFNQDVAEMEYTLTFEGTDLRTRAHRVAIKPTIHPQPV